MKAFGVSLLLAMTVPAWSPSLPAASIAEAARDIGTGDALRKPLLDALRGPVGQDLAQPVQFVVDTLRVQGGWAFVVATPQTPAGKPIDFTRTHYADAIAEGVFDGGTVFALLRSERGVWSVTTFVIGPTDVAYLAWPEQYGAPSTLFERAAD